MPLAGEILLDVCAYDLFYFLEKHVISSVSAVLFLSFFSLYLPYSIPGGAALMTPGIVPRYSVASSPTTYQVQSNPGAFVAPQYIMQPPMAHVSVTQTHL